MSVGMVVFLVILGIALLITLFVISVNSFLFSRIMCIILSIAKIILFFNFLKTINSKEFTSEWFSYLFSYIYIFLTSLFFIYCEGSGCFDSGTEGVYLIGGTLLEDSNHPVGAFFSFLLGSIIIGVVALVLVQFTEFIWFLLIFTGIEFLWSLITFIQRVKDN